MWAVYADLLQIEGHPRGELISVMLERERRPSTRLFEIQRRLLAAHGSTLLPAAIRKLVGGWRRGFPNELQLTTPKQLAAVQREPSLRFVETATLVIDEKRRTSWLEALATAKLPWRRLCIDATGVDAPLEVAALLACCSAVETLQIALPSEGLELVWDGASAEQLKLLTLVDAGEVASLDAAELPRLAELRLLGTSVASDELRTSLRWSRLQRVLLATAGDHDDDSGPSVRVLVPTHRAERPDDDDDDDDDAYDDRRDTADATTAFVVVGRAVEPALLRKLAESMSIAHLSARLVTPRWLPRPATVIQLFGTADAELLPYGLAIALHNVLDAAPVALVEVDAHAARYLVLGDPPIRGTQARAVGEVQRALDLAIGCDPGAAALHGLLAELGAAPVERLLGTGGTCQLVMIDPSSAPLILPEEDDEDGDDDYDDYDGDDDGDGDGDGEGWHFEDGQAETYEEPALADDHDDHDPPRVDAAKPAPLNAATVPDAVAAVVAAEAADSDDDTSADDAEPALHEDDAPEAFAPHAGDDEDALAPPPDRTELWLEFRDHWDDRALDVDDELGELRWPDPERANDLELYLARQVAEPACGRHASALDHCSGCNAHYCVECGGGDDDRCASCAAVFAGPVIAEAARRPATT